MFGEYCRAIFCLGFGLIVRFGRDTKVCNETTVKILEGCKGLAPELLGANGEFEVLSSQVGLRPSRKGGPRVEVQVLEGGEVIVHSYGHSGAG